MGGAKTKIVGSPVVLRANNCNGVEALESRTLLSGYGPSALGASDAGAPQVELSGAFARFNSSAKAGKKVGETITVTNSGNGAASGLLPIVVETSPDGLLADATALATINKRINIKPGKSAKIPLSLTAPAQAGLFYLDVQLDPNDTLGNEILTNNTFASPARLNIMAVPFKSGSIVAQNGWGKFSLGGSASTAVVSTKIAPPSHGNRQTIVVSRAVGEDVGVAPFATVISSAPFTVTAQVEVNYKTIANGPFFGLNLYGNSGAVELGTFGVDATSGKIYDFANGQGTFLLSDGSSGAPAPLAAGTWNTFKIVANFPGGAGGPVTLSYFLNGTQVDTETTAAAASSFAYAYVWSEEGFGATADAAGTRAFDDYSVTTTAPSTLPQPNGLTFP